MVSANLTDVFFISATTGWAIGTSGTILKTVNGGSSWSSESSGSSRDLEGISFVDANNGWVAGTNGTILKTTNGGTTWVTKSSGSSNDLSDIQFVSSSTGWAVGKNGTILTSTDGGATWVTQTSANSNDIDKVFFISSGGSATGWAVSKNGNIQTIVVTTLPITLVSFKALCSSCGTGTLQWVTAIENNDKGFDIEWSADGSHWESKGVVAGNGTSSTGHSYTFTDDHLSAGTNFFRLKQMDYDGNSVYSPVVLLNNACQVTARVAVYPNPTKGMVIVESDDTRSLGTNMALINLQGQVLRNITVTQTRQGMDLSGLPASIYLLVTADGQSHKIMKQ